MTSSAGGSTTSMKHQDVWELLPWFVNGSLEDRELAQVERHIVACDECRRESSELRQLAAIMVSGKGVMVTPDEAFPELMSRIEEVENRGSSSWRRLRRLLFTGPFPRPVLAAGLMILVLAAALLWRPIDREPAANFRTLSDSAVIEPGGLRVRVVFSPRVEETALRSLLLEVGGQIVGGPSPYGVYTVELLEQEDPSARARVLEALRAREEVEFLEPLGER